MACAASAGATGRVAASNTSSTHSPTRKQSSRLSATPSRRIRSCERTLDEDDFESPRLAARSIAVQGRLTWMRTRSSRTLGTSTSKTFEPFTRRPRSFSLRPQVSRGSSYSSTQRGPRKPEITPHPRAKGPFKRPHPKSQSHDSRLLPLEHRPHACSAPSRQRPSSIGTLIVRNYARREATSSASASIGTWTCSWVDMLRMVATPASTSSGPSTTQSVAWSLSACLNWLLRLRPW